MICSHSMRLNVYLGKMSKCKVCYNLQISSKDGNGITEPSKSEVYILGATSQWILDAVQDGCRYCYLILQAVEACNRNWTFNAFDARTGPQLLHRILQSDKSMIVVWKSDVVDLAVTFSTTIHSNQTRVNGLTYGNFIEIYAEPVSGPKYSPRDSFLIS